MLTTEQFIDKAIMKHGNKYKYSHVKYNGTENYVEIECPIHGIFQQKPKRHLLGCGCPKCKSDKAKRLICGVGINDLYGVSNTQSYKIWDAMIRRCYSEIGQNGKLSYIGCSVCNSWLTFSNFKEWFENPANGYKEGYQLDKDILIKGNKVYSPETCCFVPSKLNVLLRSKRVDLNVYQSSTYRYHVDFTINREHVSLGHFSDKQEALDVAAKYRSSLIKHVSYQYYNNNEITSRVYEAIQKQWV